MKKYSTKQNTVYCRRWLHKKKLADPEWNKRRNREQSRRHRRKLGALANENSSKLIKRYVRFIRNTARCNRCEFRHPGCIQFHHRDPSQKLFNIGSSVMPIRIQKVRDEIKKCEILCSNCHDIHHYYQRLWCA